MISPHRDSLDAPYNEEAYILSILSLISPDMHYAAEQDLRLMLEMRSKRAAVPEEPTYIYCDQCETVKPLLKDEMPGKDVTGQFGKPTDFICADCRLVIATTFEKGG